MGKPALLDQPRSPEREELAQAIGRHQRAQERVERVASLLNERFIGPAQERLETAERALKKALAQEPQRTVAELLGDHVPGPSVEDAELEVGCAKEGLKLAERTRSVLYTEQRDAENERQLAKRHLDAEIRNVVRAECAEKLLARFEAVKMETERQREVLTFLSGCLPANWDSIRYYPQTGADAEWRTAMMDLSENPDSELPK